MYKYIFLLLLTGCAANQPTVPHTQYSYEKIGNIGGWTSVYKVEIEGKFYLATYLGGHTNGWVIGPEISNKLEKE